MIDAVEKRLFSACSTLFMLLVVIKITLNPAPLAQSAWYFYIFFLGLSINYIVVIIMEMNTQWSGSKFFLKEHSYC